MPLAEATKDLMPLAEATKDLMPLAEAIYFIKNQSNLKPLSILKISVF